jgi:hypothetical protein
MANFLKQAASNMLGSDKNLDAKISGRGFGEGTMRFPMDLGDNGRPIIHFTCEPTAQDEKMESIFFPIPQGVTYGDGASYTTFDVGLIGEFAKVISANSDANIGDAALNMARQAQKMVTTELEAVGGLGATIIASKKLGFDNIATGLEFANKQVMNPRTNSAFSGNTIRNFQFDFKMIGKSDKEVKMIDSIQETFRRFVYAEKLNKTSSFMLRYPPKWVIRFVDPQQNELKYMPKIYSCYLTAVNTVINPSSNTFRREDLSPYEIDMSLQFQETKILTRDEFVNLEENGNRDNEQDAAFESLIQKTKDAGQLGVDVFKKTLSNATDSKKE